MSTGTIAWKALAGRVSSRIAPMIPPIADATPSSSDAVALALEFAPVAVCADERAGNRPTVFETFAVTGGMPTPISTGNETSVPDPTTVLIVPAQMPAARTSSPCQTLTTAPHPIDPASAHPCPPSAMPPPQQPAETQDQRDERSREEPAGPAGPAQRGTRPAIGPSEASGRAGPRPRRVLQVLPGVADGVDRAPGVGALAAGDERADVDDPLALLAGDARPVVGVGGVRQILVLAELVDAGARAGAARASPRCPVVRRSLIAIFFPRSTMFWIIAPELKSLKYSVSLSPLA